ncbi:MAG: prepilin peptidase [Tenericutes bacterium]|nr:prepilin peptidase [Mycoplasmatota bacterium]
MKIYFTIVFFLLGTILGSFYNVVGYRLCKNESIIKPGSHCPKCNHKLSFLELIPVLSYIFLKGRCKACKEKISLFYPLIELFTGLLFATCFYSFGFSYDLLISLSLVSLLSIVIVSDVNFYIIPDEVTIFFGILIIIINILKYGFVSSLTYILYGVIMFLFMYLIMILGKFMFKEEALGGGDVKLLFVLGLTLPIMSSFLSLILATLIAFPISLYLLLSKKDKIIPFGPFLVLGTLIIFLMKIDINTVINYVSLIY